MVTAPASITYFDQEIAAMIKFCNSLSMQDIVWKT